MSLPTAPPGAPPATLPPRASYARYCLYGAAPLAFLTFIASSQSASSSAARAALIVAAFIAPVVLVVVGMRVAADHQPAALPRPADAPGRAGRWDWSDVVAFLPAAAAGVLLTGSVIVGITQALDGGLQATARTAVESFAGQASSYAAAVAALAVLLLLRRGLRLRDLGWRLPRSLGPLGWLPWLAIGIVGAVVALIVAEWLGSLATQILPNSPNTQCTSVRDEYGGYVAVAIPLVCVIAPLAEESIFRGFVYGWLRRRLPVLPAVVISAAVFSAAHVVLVLALPLFGVGVILALLYEYSDSLLPGAIVHGLFNLVGIIAILGTTTSC
ncbi:MAG: CPBP family intramembrane metalloprotease [Candidatus Dormibacteraeota bacterium]|nr:CPBP family intramembrane metalloprotease [Candidatus Dormibacteraeota bacterium]